MSEAPEQRLERLLTTTGLPKNRQEEEISTIGQIVDLAGDLASEDGLRHAVAAIEKLHKRKLSSFERAVLGYFEGNAHSSLDKLMRSESDEAHWAWERPELELAVRSLRKSSREADFSKLDVSVRCAVLTNLANELNHVGRSYEALELHDVTLSHCPTFAMALGSKGCLLSYKVPLIPEGDNAYFAKYAVIALMDALSRPDEITQEALLGFMKHCSWLQNGLDQQFLSGDDAQATPSNLGKSKDECAYRWWCLRQRLFLNVLNDLGTLQIAASDPLQLPAITVKTETTPFHFGLFNLLKQEYVSARYLFWKACRSSSFSHDGVHFSDRGVLLVNTLDYAAHLLPVEEMKAAFKSAYSVFDKVAFFLNAYLELGIPEKNVSFRTMWYADGSRKRGIRGEFGTRRNWPLRGLYWLSKDLHEDRPDFLSVMEPEAAELAELRNHLEHKYLKVHMPPWTPPEEHGSAFDVQPDGLAFSISLSDFQAKTLRLLKLSRSAIMSLAEVVYVEELGRESQRGHKKGVMPMPMFFIEDEWKRL